MQLTTAGPQCYSPPQFFYLTFETDSAWYMLTLTGTNQGSELSGGKFAREGLVAANSSPYVEHYCNPKENLLGNHKLLGC